MDATSSDRQRDMRHIIEASTRTVASAHSPLVSNPPGGLLLASRQLASLVLVCSDSPRPDAAAHPSACRTASLPPSNWTAPLPRRLRGRAVGGRPLGNRRPPSSYGLSSPYLLDFEGLNVHEPPPHLRQHVWTSIQDVLRGSMLTTRHEATPIRDRPEHRSLSPPPRTQRMLSRTTPARSWLSLLSAQTPAPRQWCRPGRKRGFAQADLRRLRTTRLSLRALVFPRNRRERNPNLFPTAVLCVANLPLAALQSPCTAVARPVPSPEAPFFRGPGEVPSTLALRLDLDSDAGGSLQLSSLQKLAHGSY